MIRIFGDLKISGFRNLGIEDLVTWDVGIWDSAICDFGSWDFGFGNLGILEVRELGLLAYGYLGIRD